MAMSVAERKQNQRNRSKEGAVSAEKVRSQLLYQMQLQVSFWCMDTTRTEPTAMDVISAVAEQYPMNQRARVLAYLGIPVEREGELEELLERSESAQPARGGG